VPVRWKVYDILEAHDISVYRLMKESGLAQGTVYRLVKGDTSTVNAETLDRVMTTLRRLTGQQLQISDLLEYDEPRTSRGLFD
jgi:DNA-binding Xre family transcriptional regulator